MCMRAWLVRATQGRSTGDAATIHWIICSNMASHSIQILVAAVIEVVLPNFKIRWQFCTEITDFRIKECQNICWKYLISFFKGIKIVSFF